MHVAVGFGYLLLLEEERRSELVGLKRCELVLLHAFETAELEELVCLIDFFNLLNVEVVGGEHTQELTDAEQFIEVGVVGHRVAAVSNIVI